MSDNNYVFIYGSLKRGYHNAHWMTHATYINDAVTSKAEYEMHATSGMFPLVVPGDKKIAGELYAVDDSVLKALDLLEGNGDIYTRVQIKLSGVDALCWMYVYNFPDTIPLADGLEFLVDMQDLVQTWLRPEDYFKFKV